MLTSHIISALKKEQHFLRNMINDINKELRHLPSGSVQIITMETGRIPLNSIIVERLIRHYLLLE